MFNHVAGLLCNFTFVGVMRPVRDRPITELSLVMINMMVMMMMMMMRRRMMNCTVLSPAHYALRLPSFSGHVPVHSACLTSLNFITIMLMGNTTYSVGFILLCSAEDDCPPWIQWGVSMNKHMFPCQKPLLWSKRRSGKDWDLSYQKRANNLGIWWRWLPCMDPMGPLHAQTHVLLSKAKRRAGWERLRSQLSAQPAFWQPTFLSVCMFRKKP